MWIALWVLISAAVAFAGAAAMPDEPRPPDVRIKLRKDIASVQTKQTDDGTRLTVPTESGDVEMSPEQFADLLAQEKAYQEGSWEATAMYWLNISSWFNLFWVALGLVGQVLFTGRMLVQWLVSEKHKRSTIPTAFWWMSLGGASMLLTYFIWRRDVVGVLGQFTGWFIYLRNLWMIYLGPNGKRQKTVGEVVVEEESDEAT